MSTPPQTPPQTPPPTRPDGRPPQLPAGTKVIVGVLLAIPCLALALVPTYSSETPTLLGWPFFYWYQLLWVILTPLMTYGAYVLIKRARGEK